MDHHVRYSLPVCETLNFTMAAERCNVAQSALSRAIRQLEEEVGGPLIRRGR
jgi:DNA-binding transcriptional LysR family regulator